MHRRFIPAVEPPGARDAPAWWFAFAGDALLVREDGVAAEPPCLVDIRELDLAPVRRQYLGALAGRDCYAVELARETAPPAGWTVTALRGLYGRLDDDLFAIAGRAV